PRPRREVPAHGRPAARCRRPHRRRATRRRRAVGLKRLAVLGWPVDYSRSPAMQNAALAATGLDGAFVYERLAVAPEAFAEPAAGLAGSGFAGVNVTIPHKEAALAIATRASADARAIGAANTLTFGPGEGTVRADHTDHPGPHDPHA